MVPQRFIVNLIVDYGLSHTVSFHMLNLSGTKKFDKVMNMSILKEICENAQLLVGLITWLNKVKKSDSTEA